MRLIDRNFQVDDAVFEHFFKFLASEEIPFTKKELLENKDQLAMKIKAEIFWSIWGAEARQRVFISEDPQVREAVKAIPDAAALMKDPKAYLTRLAGRDKEGF